ncbi:MAG: protein translocase subunit SecD, partial [Verrucomicrobia bacterium]|nr:protein translocase subunit SecD [Cytophagales bacterium]
MRNRLGIVIIIVALVIYCAVWLSFTFVARKIGNESLAFATNPNGSINYSKKQAYEDSLWSKKVYLGQTYQFIKENELNLGLDLQGGMHVVMEVSPIEVIKAFSSNNQDAKFLQSLRDAKVAQNNSQKKFTDLFYEAFQKNAPGVKLSSIFANSNNKEEISFQSSDKEVLKVINQKVEGAIEQSLEIVRTRIDQFGVVQPNVQRLGTSGRIQVELPGVDNPDRVRKLLAGVANLEFWEVYEPQAFFPYLQQLDTYLTAKEKLAEKKDTTTAKAGTDSTNSVAKADSSQGSLADQLKETPKDTSAAAKADSAKKPSVTGLVKYFQPQFLQYGQLVVQAKDTSKINRLLEDPNVKALFPSNLKFLWEKPFRKDNENAANSRTRNIRLYAIKKTADGKAPLEGDVIKDARQDFGDLSKKAEVVMQMTPNAAAKWKKLTAASVGKQVAIVLDNFVYSAPNVNEEIPNGRSSISGGFSIEEAQDLATVLRAGKLPAPIQIVEETVVGPTLGKEAIQQGLVTIIVSFLTIIVFMVLYYNTSGLVADLAVLLNLLFILGFLPGLPCGAVLTLPGIAGMVLSVGMAV